MMLYAFLPTVGMPEMLILAFVCLLIFGNRLPGVMRSLGKSVTEFKKGISGIEEEIDQAGNIDKKPSRDEERDRRAREEADQAVTAERKSNTPGS
jgi:sec-independent protein translocase protein TatA